ncbi:hypothetical protein BGX34_000620 [Mortierella sp. NVP85]|nr:hypothetical protein BGX34_000620 [Mortierella sp. NVP85]
MQALEVPEILRLLGEFLDYRRLTAATAVCKTWNTIFTPLLYHTLEWTHHIWRHPRPYVVKGHIDHIHVIKISSMPWIPPLKGCTQLAELHLNLDFGEYHDIDESWIPITKLIRQNPRLVTVCVTKPSNGLLRAVFTCCFQLKRLEINGANFTDCMMTDLLFNISLRLEELKMVDLTLDVDLGRDIVSWANWPVFPKIKKLWVGITHERHWIYCGTTQQPEFIKRCPNLESLAWSFSKGPIPIREIRALLSPETSLCPKIKAFEFHCPGLHLPEDTTSALGQALIKGLASTLTRLRIDNAPPNISPTLMRIFSSCPHLLHVNCYGGRLDVRDILGIKSGKDKGSTAKTRGTMFSANGQPLPTSIHPPKWACKNLQTLDVDICGLQGKEPEWHLAVLTQLAKLTRLRVLGVGRFSSENEKIRDGLDLRYLVKVQTPSSFTMLEELRFGSVWQEMERRYIKWLTEAWPRLSYIDGWVHHLRVERYDLIDLFNKHGVTVKYAFGFDPPFQDDSDDESDGGSYMDEDEDEDEDEEDGGSEYIDEEEVDGLNDDAADFLDPHHELSSDDGY